MILLSKNHFRVKNVYSLLFTTCMSVSSLALAAPPTTGTVHTVNGDPVAQAMVIAETRDGADVVTVFTNSQGEYRFPDTETLIGQPHARVMGLKQIADQNGHLVLAPAVNVADVAPASGWLNSIPQADKSKFVLNCVNCHQVPSGEVRNFASLIEKQATPDKKAAREQSWHAVADYMNRLWAYEVLRGDPSIDHELSGAYFIADVPGISKLMSEHFAGPMQQLDSYEYGAPIIATSKTTIREYEIAEPNAIREALLLDGDLWIADVNTNRMYTANIATGEQAIHEVPVELPMGPHTIHPGADRSLWIAPMYNGYVAHRDIEKGEWKTWQLKSREGKLIGIHDLSFGSDHQLLKDKKGRIWYSDIANSAVGWFDPDTGDANIYPSPQPSDRTHLPTQLYGLAMTDDQKYVWYSQLGNGVIGCFNIETEQFEDVVTLPDPYSGARRITMGANDILYVAMFGSGQIAAYDTKARKMIGIYDLPDRGSAPYAVTWDPVREVVWIPTSNTDVIYRFDPKDASFGVLPLPRQRAFLRMVDVDPATGALVTSYANIIEEVQGPRMALVIEPGDDAYSKKLDFGGAK